MKEETLVLKNRAEEGRLLYKQGKITREECKEYVMPYLDAVNEKSKEIAKKYGMKPKLVKFITFIRQEVIECQKVQKYFKIIDKTKEVESEK